MLRHLDERRAHLSTVARIAHQVHMTQDRDSLRLEIVSESAPDLHETVHAAVTNRLQQLGQLEHLRIGDARQVDELAHGLFRRGSGDQAFADRIGERLAAQEIDPVRDIDLAVFRHAQVVFVIRVLKIRQIVTYGRAPDEAARIEIQQVRSNLVILRHDEHSLDHIRQTGFEILGKRFLDALVDQPQSVNSIQHVLSVDRRDESTERTAIQAVDDVGKPGFELFAPFDLFELFSVIGRGRRALLRRCDRQRHKKYQEDGCRLQC